MLTIKLREQELWDSRNERFIKQKPLTLQLEHSLISMSKWESIWLKPFIEAKGIDSGIKTHTEELSYVECMIIGRIDSFLIPAIYQQHGRAIQEYIANPNTATTIHRVQTHSSSRQTVTTELIYYWMVRFNIPNEFERWHINRLLMLIEICNIKEKEAAGKNNLTPKEAAKFQYQANKARRGL